MSKLRILAVVTLALPLLGGCIVVRPGPPPCRHVWVAGHYDRAGYWHRAHWRCVY